MMDERFIIILIIVRDHLCKSSVDKCVRLDELACILQEVDFFLSRWVIEVIDYRHVPHVHLDQIAVVVHLCPSR